MTTELNKSPPTPSASDRMISRLEASTDMLDMLLQMFEPLASQAVVGAWRKGIEINRAAIAKARGSNEKNLLLLPSPATRSRHIR